MIVTTVTPPVEPRFTLDLSLDEARTIRAFLQNNGREAIAELDRLLAHSPKHFLLSAESEGLTTISNVLFVQLQDAIQAAVA